MKREKFKEVEIEGRKFRIGRFDALTGSYITTLLLMQMLPMGMDVQVGLGSLAQGRSLMDKNTFFDLQKDCLKICSEVVSLENVDAPIPAMLADGRWGIPDIENNAQLVLSLVIQTLVFNIADFFQGDALKGLIESVTSDMSLFNAKK